MIKKGLKVGIILIGICLMIGPIWMMLSGSLMGSVEINEHIGGILNGTTKYANWSWIPLYPTLRSYIEVLLDSPEFFHMFWNSFRQTGVTISGYLLVALPASWAFSRYEFPFKRVIYDIYIVLMILPFQVTMVSNYLVIRQAGLMDSELAIILPALFSTFPVFIMTRFFREIPVAFFEAAKVDGANEWEMFVKIGIPMGYPGVIAAIVLGFLDNWNAIEQPLIFLQTKSKWPLSLYLPEISAEKVGTSFVTSVLAMLPSLLIFLVGQNYLEEGIQATGVKG